MATCREQMTTAQATSRDARYDTRDDADDERAAWPAMSNTPITGHWPRLLATTRPARLSTSSRRNRAAAIMLDGDADEEHAKRHGAISHRF